MACSYTALSSLFPPLVSVLPHGCTPGATGKRSLSFPLYKRVVEKSAVGINLQKSRPVPKGSQTIKNTLSRNLGHGVR